MSCLNAVRPWGWYRRQFAQCFFRISSSLVRFVGTKTVNEWKQSLTKTCIIRSFCHTVFRKGTRPAWGLRLISPHPPRCSLRVSCRFWFNIEGLRLFRLLTAAVHLPCPTPAPAVGRVATPARSTAQQSYPPLCWFMLASPSAPSWLGVLS